MDETIADNLASVRRRVADACARSGRMAEQVTLIAVTKTTPPESVRAAHALGLCDFGENRVQEARTKLPLLADLPVRWHMIGHLQSNKAGQAAQMFHCIHSVDSVSIAEHLSRRVAEGAQPLPVLIEVNVGDEPGKTGFAAGATEQAAFFAAIERILSLPALDVQGLMTVAPIVPSPDDVRPFFRRLAALRRQAQQRWPDHSWRHLSMGMTDDFEVAIEEGATMIRLGRAIFGQRRA